MMDEPPAQEADEESKGRAAAKRGREGKQGGTETETTNASRVAGGSQPLLLRSRPFGKLSTKSWSLEEERQQDEQEHEQQPQQEDERGKDDEEQQEGSAADDADGAAPAGGPDDDPPGDDDDASDDAPAGGTTTTRKEKRRKPTGTMTKNWTKTRHSLSEKFRTRWQKTFYSRAARSGWPRDDGG